MADSAFEACLPAGKTRPKPAAGEFYNRKQLAKSW
jgi:hypothetical protein